MDTERKKQPSSEGEPKECPERRGRGWVDNRCPKEDHAHKCMYCDGKGFDALENICYACHGTGQIEIRQVDKDPCPLCAGAGVYPVPESMTMAEFAFSLRKRAKA